MISYAIPEIEMLIGGADITPYLVSLSISPGISDITQHLVWQGDFELIRPLNAAREDDWFSEIESPQRWRRGLQQIELNLLGQPALKLRIDSYRYYQGVGRGTLTQITGLADYDRPSVDVPEIRIGGGNSLREAVRLLAQAAFAGLGSPPAVTVGSSMSGLLDADLLTQNPIKDAQRIAGVTWHWLHVDENENVQTVQRPTEARSPLFRRGIKDTELVPDEENLNFAAEQVIITGACQQAKPYTVDLNVRYKSVYRQPTRPQRRDLDSQKRARRTQTSTNNFRYKVFQGAGLDGGLPANRTIVEAGRKTIYYRYGDSEDVGLRESGIPAALYNLYWQAQPIQGVSSDAIATLTLTYKTRGEAEGTTDERLFLASADCETQDVKQTYKTRFEAGLTDSLSDAGGTTLEYWDEEYIERGLTQTQQEEDEETDPRTGRPRQYESRGQLEPRQIAPEFDLETVPLKGECRLKPVAWNTFLEQTHREDVGFLPDQQAADLLARAVAFREMARRDAYLVTMPLPSEWVSAGCPPFPIVHVGKHCFLMDAPIIELTDQRLQFSFTGERLGSVPAVKSRSLPAPFINSGSLQIVPEGSIVGIPGEAVNVQLQATNGTQPYTFSGSLPAGLSLSPDGIVSGTITGTHTGTATVTVTDSAGVSSTLDLSFELDPTPEVSYPYAVLVEMAAGIRLGVEVYNNVQLLEAGVKYGVELLVTPVASLTRIAYWSMDSSAWTDSVNGYNLSANGTVNCIAGYINNCAQCIGFGALESTQTALSTGNVHWKMQAWLYIPASAFSNQDIAGNWNSSPEWLLRLTGSDTLEFRVYSAATYDAVVSGVLARDNWHRIIIESNPGSGTISVRVGSSTSSNALTITPVSYPSPLFFLAGGSMRWDEVEFFKA